MLVNNVPPRGSQIPNVPRRVGTVSVSTSTQPIAFGTGINPGAEPFAPAARLQADVPAALYQTNGLHVPPQTPDSWIFETDQPTGESFLRPPRLELMKFDGNPLNWPLFSQTFKIQVHDVVKSDAERIAHLANCLPLQIRSQLSVLLMHPTMYRNALAELHRIYGSRTVVVTACNASLDNLKPFANHDQTGLSRLSAALRSVVATLQLSCFDAEIQSYSNFESVVRKISPKLQERWSMIAWNMQPDIPTLIDLSEFLFDACMMEHTRRLGRADALGLGANPLFKQSEPKKRTEVVKKAALCLRCLRAGHVGRDCNRDRKCGKDGCPKTHYPLMHEAPRLYPKKSTPPARAAPSEDSQQSREPADAFNGAIGKGNGQRVLLPIVPVALEANGCSVRTYAFLDQGSEVTLVRADIAKALYLPALSLSVETVNGRAHQNLTKLPPVTIASRDGAVKIVMKDALAIDNLRLNLKTREAQVIKTQWHHLTGCEFHMPDPKEVTLLIGVDQPAAHEVLEYRKDPLNIRAPRGLLTHFGWCVAGPTAAMGLSPYSCYSISLPEGDEEDARLQRAFKAFIGVEQFGTDARKQALVPVKVKRALDILENSTKRVGERYEVGILWAEDSPSLPDNRDLALRWFLSQEARLAKNPEPGICRDSHFNSGDTDSAILYKTLAAITIAIIAEETTGDSDSDSFLRYFCQNGMYFLTYYLNRYLFARKKTSISKLSSFKRVLNGDITLPPRENIRSTAALDGIAVLYFVKILEILGNSFSTSNFSVGFESRNRFTSARIGSQFAAFEALDLRIEKKSFFSSGDGVEKAILLTLAHSLTSSVTSCICNALSSKLSESQVNLNFGWEAAANCRSRSRKNAENLF